jgi:hypothetical protein
MFRSMKHVATSVGGAVLFLMLVASMASAASYGSGIRQLAGQVNYTNQQASSKATSTQIVPINANVPVSVLSLGSNNGPVSQSNSSTANSAAVNSNSTGQLLGQIEG